MEKQPFWVLNIFLSYHKVQSLKLFIKSVELLSHFCHHSETNIQNYNVYSIKNWVESWLKEIVWDSTHSILSSIYTYVN